MTATETPIMNQNTPLPRRHHQRGAVVVVLGVTLVLLIGFAGLAIDLGRFFVIKSELQNAMDACALAAASQLRPGQNDDVALTRAVAYGRVFATGGTGNNEAIKNKANFQSTVVAISDSQITFSDTLNNSNYWDSSGSYNTARYAKCEYPLADLPIYFMRVLNVALSTQTVSAMAAATRGRQVCNVIPAGICQRNFGSGLGLYRGEWLSIGAKMEPGWFGWVDYSPAGGGTPEVKDGLTDVGQCNIPVVGATAQENGKKTSAEEAWNTRFGIYSNPYRISDITTIPPDKTGYAYFGQDVGAATNPKRLVANWPRTDAYVDEAATPRAYDQTHPTATSSPKFQDAAESLLEYQSEARTIFSGPTAFASGGITTPPSPLGENGRTDRRLLVVPVLDCSSKPMVITGLACTLMLNPFGRVAGLGGGPVNGKLEYQGLANVAGSPCGNDNVTGPTMTVLVK